MDIATIIGVLFATITVIAAILVSGSLTQFADLPSTLIVIGGMTATVVLRFPLSGVLSALFLGAGIAFKNKSGNPRDMIEEIAKLADIIRRSGPLGLENIKISDPFLSKGIQYVVDDYETSFISKSLECERDYNLERLEEGKSIFKAMADSAPAFGMIGTLIGLVQMLQTMDDPSTIGPSMAVALLTTLYGALIANVICMPIHDKLIRKIKNNELMSTLMIDGVLQIRENKSPDIIRDLLFSYLPEKQRKISEE
ncbi:MAG: MotA/TolQ/ExbB proton channel family protein [Alphaproteobacteria bacterium]|nr:MotA/TolQ/ExbB proton channel family protein [Alphaproteobacteria bacterium]